MKAQCLFSGKTKKKVNLLSAGFAHRFVKVKMEYLMIILG